MILLLKEGSYVYFQKKKGRFHHSSFLAGGATLAAGRVVVDNGVLKVKLFFSFYEWLVTWLSVSAFVIFFLSNRWLLVYIILFQTISAYSGHYRPSDDSLETFLSFLRENSVSLDGVEVKKNSCSTQTLHNQIFLRANSFFFFH